MQKKKYYSLMLSQDKTILLSCKPSVKRVKIPSGVEVVDKGAFAYCLHLESVIIPNTVKTIRAGAFLFSRIKIIYIPKSVTFIDKEAFQEMTYLDAIVVDPNNPAYSSLDGILYDKKKETLLSFPPFKLGNPFTIPQSVKAVYFEDLTRFNYVFSLVINENLEELHVTNPQGYYSLNRISIHPENKHFYIKDKTLYDSEHNPVFELEYKKKAPKRKEHIYINPLNQKLEKQFMHRSFAILCKKEYLDYFVHTSEFSTKDRYLIDFQNDIDRIGEVLLWKKSPFDQLDAIRNKLFGEKAEFREGLRSLVGSNKLNDVSIMEIFLFLWWIAANSIFIYTEECYISMSEDRVVATLLEALITLYEQ